MPRKIFFNIKLAYQLSSARWMKKGRRPNIFVSILLTRNFSYTAWCSISQADAIIGIFLFSLASWKFLIFWFYLQTKEHIRRLNQKRMEPIYVRVVPSAGWPGSTKCSCAVKILKFHSSHVLWENLVCSSVW